MGKHRFINTSLGEIMLVGGFDYATQEHFCEMYTGDNYDDYLGDINCRLDDDEDKIMDEIELALLPY